MTAEHNQSTKYRCSCMIGLETRPNLQKLWFLILHKTHTFQYYKKLGQILEKNKTSAPRCTIWGVRSQIWRCLVQRFPKWVVFPKRPEANHAKCKEGKMVLTIYTVIKWIRRWLFLTATEYKCMGEPKVYYCIIIPWSGCYIRNEQVFKTAEYNIDAVSKNTGIQTPPHPRQGSPPCQMWSM